MKKIITISLLILCNLFAYSQQPPTFYQFMSSYFTRIDPDEDENSSAFLEKGFSEEVKNAYKIWGKRVYPAGDFRNYASSLYNYTLAFNQQTLCSQNTFNTTWTNLGPFGLPSGSPSGGNGNGVMSRIKFDPGYNGVSNKIIYAASNFGGLWKTIDGGDNWYVLNTDRQLPVTSVSDVAIDYANTNNLFISTGYGDGGISFTSTINDRLINPIFTIGIYRSIDGGQNWTAINNGFLSNFSDGGVTRRIVINKDNSNEVFVATSKGIFKTSNALAATPTWQNNFTGTSGTTEDFRGLEFKYNPSSTILYCSSNKGIYKSTNSGITWSALTGPGTGLDLNAFTNTVFPRINIALSGANDNKVYAYLIGNNTVTNTWTAYIYLFDGTSWTLKHQQTASGVIDAIAPAWIGIAVSPVNPNEVVFGNTMVQWTSNINNANSFTNISNYGGNGNHPDFHDLVYEPITSNPKLYTANDGGICVCGPIVNNSPEWSFKSNGICVSTVWQFDDSNIDSKETLMGNQDCGVNFKKSDTWSHIFGGDGYAAQFAWPEDDIMFCKSNSALIRYNGTTSSYALENSSLNNVMPYEPNSTTVKATSNQLKIVTHPETHEKYFYFSEVYKRLHKIPVLPDDQNNPNLLWSLESDITKVLAPAWMRQPGELVISKSNPNYIFLSTIGQDNGQGASWQLQPKLFRSTTGFNAGNYNQNKFSDITQNLPQSILSGTPTTLVITGLAISTTDNNKVWVTFTGYDPAIKIWKTTNAGTSWVNADPTGCVANLSVNCIAYQDGTDDLIYIGTDAGVFYKDNSMSNWERFGDIPNCRILDLKINYCSGTLKASTFGRGIWETALHPGGKITKEILITSNPTWSTPQVFEENIKITSGHQLTVTSTVYMPEGGKITVEVGAKLIINGGTITNNCGKFWDGIQVLGQYNVTQIDEDQQGVVNLINNGTISYAITPIQAIKINNDGSSDWSTTGGIIKVDNGNLTNNKRGIWIGGYQAYIPQTNPPIPLPNKGSITNSHFLINNLYPQNENLHWFIGLLGVNGVQIKGNTFENINTSQYMTPYSSRGSGIISYTSSFNSDYYCSSQMLPCPEISKVPNTFIGLNYGIQVYNTGGDAPVYIENNIFENVYRGVFLNGCSKAMVLKNSYSIPNYDDLYIVSPNTEIYKAPYGIYLNGCTGFRVEENNLFASSGNGHYENTNGIYVRNSLANSNELYKNTFTNLMYGITALDINKKAGTVDVGLKILCNTFNNNFKDVDITSSDITLSPIGIAQYQLVSGINNLGIPFQNPAENIFSLNCNDIDSDFDNYHADNVTYFHKPGTSGTDHWIPYCYSNIMNHSIQPGYTLCPSKIVNNDNNHLADLYTQTGTARMQLNSSNLLLNIWQNGGIENLKEEVDLTLPWKAYDEFNVLMLKSPYLTTDVLKSVVLNSVFSDLMVKLIMLANPQSSRSEEIIYLLKNRVPVFPEDYIEEIENLSKTISQLDILRANVSSDQHLLNQIYNNITEIYTSDFSNIYPKDSIINFLQRQESLESKYDLLSVYYSRNQTSEINDIIQALPGQFTLDDAQQLQYLKTKNYYDVANRLTSGRIVRTQPSIGTADSLDNLVEGEDSYISNWAISLKKQISPNYIYSEITSHSGKDYEPKKSNNKSKEIESTLKVYPNPTKNHLIVKVQLGNSFNKTWIEIEDSNGRLIVNKEFQPNDSELLINVSNYEPGAYFVNLYGDGKKISSEKVLIVR